LLKQRDASIWAWAAAHLGEIIFEDRKLDVTSQLTISVEETLREVEKMIAAEQV